MFDIFIVFVVTVIIGLGIALIITWPTMLLFGVVHSFLPLVPAFSFGQTLAIMLLLRLVLPTPVSVPS